MSLRTFGNPWDSDFPVSAAKTAYPKWRGARICKVLSVIFFDDEAFPVCSRISLSLCSVCRHAARELLGYPVGLRFDAKSDPCSVACDGCTVSGSSRHDVTTCLLLKTASLDRLVFAQLQTAGYFKYSQDSENIARSIPSNLTLPARSSGLLSAAEVAEISHHAAARRGELEGLHLAVEALQPPTQVVPESDSAASGRLRVCSRSYTRSSPVATTRPRFNHTDRSYDD